MSSSSSFSSSVITTTMSTDKATSKSKMSNLKKHSETSNKSSPKVIRKSGGGNSNMNSSNKLKHFIPTEQTEDNDKRESIIGNVISKQFTSTSTFVPVGSNKTANTANTNTNNNNYKKNNNKDNNSNSFNSSNNSNNSNNSSNNVKANTSRVPTDQSTSPSHINNYSHSTQGGTAHVTTAYNVINENHNTHNNVNNNNANNNSKRQNSQSDQIINHVNDLLRFCNIHNVVTNIRQCTSSFFVLIYQRLFDCTIPGIDRSPNTLEKKLQNIRLVFDELQRRHYNLSHISIEEVCKLSEEHISRLVHVFVHIASRMYESQQQHQQQQQHQHQQQQEHQQLEDNNSNNNNNNNNNNNSNENEFVQEEKALQLFYHTHGTFQPSMQDVHVSSLVAPATLGQAAMPVYSSTKNATTHSNEANNENAVQVSHVHRAHVSNRNAPLPYTVAEVRPREWHSFTQVSLPPPPSSLLHSQPIPESSVTPKELVYEQIQQQEEEMYEARIPHEKTHGRGHATNAITPNYMSHTHHNHKNFNNTTNNNNNNKKRGKFAAQLPDKRTLLTLTSTNEFNEFMDDMDNSTLSEEDNPTSYDVHSHVQNNNNNDNIINNNNINTTSHVIAAQAVDMPTRSHTMQKLIQHHNNNSNTNNEVLLQEQDEENEEDEGEDDSSSAIPTDELVKNWYSGLITPVVLGNGINDAKLHLDSNVNTPPRHKRHYRSYEQYYHEFSPESQKYYKEYSHKPHEKNTPHHKKDYYHTEEEEEWEEEEEQELEYYYKNNNNNDSNTKLKGKRRLPQHLSHERQRSTPHLNNVNNMKEKQNELREVSNSNTATPLKSGSAAAAQAAAGLNMAKSNDKRQDKTRVHASSHRKRYVHQQPHPLTASEHNTNFTTTSSISMNKNKYASSTSASYHSITPEKPSTHEAKESAAHVNKLLETTEHALASSNPTSSSSSSAEMNVHDEELQIKAHGNHHAWEKAMKTNDIVKRQRRLNDKLNAQIHEMYVEQQQQQQEQQEEEEEQQQQYQINSSRNNNVIAKKQFSSNTLQQQTPTRRVYENVILSRRPHWSSTFHTPLQTLQRTRGTEVNGKHQHEREEEYEEEEKYEENKSNKEWASFPLTQTEEQLFTLHPHRLINSQERDRKIARLQAAKFLGSLQCHVRQKMRSSYDSSMRAMREKLDLSVQRSREHKWALQQLLRDEDTKYRKAYAILVQSAINDRKCPSSMMSLHTLNMAQQYAAELEASRVMCKRLAQEAEMRNSLDLMHYASHISAWQQQLSVETGK